MNLLNQSINRSDCRLGLLLMLKLIVIFVAGIKTMCSHDHYIYDMKFNDIKFYLKPSVLCDLKDKRKKSPYKVKQGTGKIEMKSII